MIAADRSQQQNWVNASVLCLYSVLVLGCAARHEAWLDEAQSWLLARDLTPAELLLHQTRYEGTPGLWQLLLMPFAKGAFPYTDLSFISAALGIVAVAIFLWRSPFPTWIRVLFPFCYFPAFQYAVIARSYSVFLPLLFALAASYPDRVRKRPRLYLLLTFLLANASLHGALIALVFFAEWFWQARAESWFQTRRVLACTLLTSIFALYLCLFLELRIPSDFLDRSSYRPADMLLRFGKQISEAFLGGLGTALYRAVSLTFGTAVILFSLILFRRSRALVLFAGPLILLLVLAILNQAAPWHAGIIFCLWIFASWVFLEEQPARAKSQILMVLMAVVFVFQVSFGLRSLRYDWSQSYSGSRAAAEYLKRTQKDRTYLYTLGFKSFAIQPYFDRNLFEEQEHGRKLAFSPWTRSLDHRFATDLDPRVVDYVIVSSDARADQIDRVRASGYCEERRFEGAIWWKNGKSEPDTYILFKRCETSKVSELRE